MGYNLAIGQLKTTIESEGLHTRIVNDVEPMRLDEAPAYGEPTDGTNQRWPSYTVWRNAMDFIGLSDLMYNNEHGLLRSHPGCFPLTKAHKKAIDEARKNFYKKYPNCKPGYEPGKDIFLTDPDPSWPIQNSYATRLEWLKFWVDWALKNCSQPVFYNS